MPLDLKLRVLADGSNRFSDSMTCSSELALQLELLGVVVPCRRPQW
jgi:hypothetical protein